MLMRISVRSPSNRSCSIGSSFTGPRKASQRVAHAHTQHHGNKSAKYTRSDVERGLAPSSLFEHTRGGPAESGKSGDSAHQSDGQADAQIGANGNVVEAELPDHAQDKAAQQIHGKRSGRKNGTPPILNPAVQPVASQSPHRAKYNQEYDPHTCSVSGPIAGPFLGVICGPFCRGQQKTPERPRARRSHQSQAGRFEANSIACGSNATWRP